jgi:hypothetical protein
MHIFLTTPIKLACLQAVSNANQIAMHGEGSGLNRIPQLLDRKREAQPFRSKVSSEG